MAQQITDPVLIKVINYIHAIPSALNNNVITADMCNRLNMQDYMESHGVSNVVASLNNL